MDERATSWGLMAAAYTSFLETLIPNRFYLSSGQPRMKAPKKMTRYRMLWPRGNGALVRRIGPRTQEKEIQVYERLNGVKVDRAALRASA